jgi:hypothetical protein
VKCRDGAYRQIIVQNAAERGVAVGDFLEVEVTGHNTVYAFGEPTDGGRPVDEDPAESTPSSA